MPWRALHGLSPSVSPLTFVLLLQQGRALKAYEGCSGGSWGSVCTTVSVPLLFLQVLGRCVRRKHRLADVLC